MMAHTNPTVGATGWGPILNTALDALETATETLQTQVDLIQTQIDAIGTPGGTVIGIMPNGDGGTTFNGTGAYLEASDSSDYSIITTGELTWEVWLRLDTLNFTNQHPDGYVHFIGKGVPTQYEWVGRMYSKDGTIENRPNRTSGYAYNLAGSLGSGAMFQPGGMYGNTANPPVVSTPTVDDSGTVPPDYVVGEWVHVAVTYDYPSDTIKIYRNGVLRLTSTFTSFSVVPANGTAPLRIGTSDLAHFFKGAIAKVAIYDNELTAAQLLAHYNEMTTGVSGDYDPIVLAETGLVAYWPLGADFTDAVGSADLTNHNAVIAPSGTSGTITPTAAGVDIISNGDIVMQVDGDGLIFGQNVSLYRDVADALRLDGKFSVNGGISSTAQVAITQTTAFHTAILANVVDTASNALRGKVTGEADFRVVLNMESLQFGDGTNTPDSQIGRDGTARLSTNSTFRLKNTTTAARGSAATAGAGALQWDTDVDKMIVSNGTTWEVVTST